MEHFQMIVWKLNSLPLYSCLSYRIVLQNGVNTEKLIFFNGHKAQNLAQIEPYDLVQISPVCGPKSNFRLPVSEFATVAQKSFNGKFTAKVLIGHFMLPLQTSTLNLSIHCLISIWATCWGNINKIITYEIVNILNFLTKNV